MGKYTYLLIDALTILFPFILSFDKKVFLEFKWMTFEECRHLVRSLGLGSFEDWRMHWVLNRKPENIPYNPNKVYKAKWKGWKDFLGTDKAE